jgi:hypothetical protein
LNVRSLLLQEDRRGLNHLRGTQKYKGKKEFTTFFCPLRYFYYSKNSFSPPFVFINMAFPSI